MKFVNIEHNNKVYTINVYDSFNQLMNREELFELPLSKWNELFVKKDGRCNPYFLNQVLLKLIENYDKSTAVNSFDYKGNSYWLHKDTRMGLMNLVNCTKEAITLVLGNDSFEVSPSDLKKYLSAIEVYASKCFALTAKHKAAASKLYKVEDMLNYDYTLGYPEKVTL